MSPASNGCKYIAHGRCGLTAWPEARALRKESARVLGQWLFEDVLCRWGCIKTIITDNAPQYTAALEWIEKTYGIRGVKISSYNSQANGKIERGHWDLIQMLAKACGGDLSKWYWFLQAVLWADRVTIKRGLGCSPFFMVTGAYPILPLDLVEATWLVKYPNRILTRAELIGYRARALAKHQHHLADMVKRVSKRKREWARRYELTYRSIIKNYTFKTGDLVLMRNTAIEDSLNRKMKLRWLGPLIVIRRSKGGSYILAEMDGTTLHKKVARFRVIPYFARRKIDLPENIQDVIDISDERLNEMLEEPEPEDDSEIESLWFPNSSLREVNDSEGDLMDGDLEEPPSDSEEDEASSDDEDAPRRSSRIKKTN
jgi:hypothetical protein